MGFHVNSAVSSHISERNFKGVSDVSYKKCEPTPNQLSDSNLLSSLQTVMNKYLKLYFGYNIVILFNEERFEFTAHK